MDYREFLGRQLGRSLSILTYFGGYARRSRLFHPEGDLFIAQVDALTTRGRFGELAERLSGCALVRLSAALWRGREWADALGCAIRFDWRPEQGTRIRPQHQDLLFATIRSPLTLFLAPLTTNVHNFMENHYYAVAPFHVDGVGTVKFRLVPLHTKAEGRNRHERLEHLVQRKRAVFRLELLEDKGQPEDEDAWHGLCHICLVKRASLDQKSLLFWPFQSGKGIHPTGLVSYLRVAQWLQGSQPRRLKPGDLNS